MLLFCDNVYELTQQEYDILFSEMPLERRNRILRYVRKEDRILGAAAYALLQYAMYLSGKVREFSELEIKQNAYGKPYIKDSDIYFNISHTQNAAACAVGDAQIGVDIQKNITGYERIMESVCSPGEIERIMKENFPVQYFTRLWTLKESYVKCIGTGIWDQITRIDFSNFNTEHGMFRGHYLDCLCAQDYCVSVCSVEENIKIQKITVSEIVKYGRKGR